MIVTLRNLAAAPVRSSQVPSWRPVCHCLSMSTMRDVLGLAKVENCRVGLTAISRIRVITDRLHVVLGALQSESGLVLIWGRVSKGARVES